MSVGLDTLYVTKSHDPNEPMVTLRSAVLDNGYITTIRAKDWFSLSEKIERELYYKRIDFVVTLLDIHMYIRIPTFTHMYVYMLLMLSFIIYIHFITRLYWMRRRDLQIEGGPLPKTVLCIRPSMARSLRVQSGARL